MGHPEREYCNITIVNQASSNSSMTAHSGTPRSRLVSPSSRGDNRKRNGKGGGFAVLVVRFVEGKRERNTEWCILRFVEFEIRA